jgi:hypothetical protein
MARHKNLNLLLFLQKADSFSAKRAWLLSHMWIFSAKVCWEKCLFSWHFNLELLSFVRNLWLPRGVGEWVGSVFSGRCFLRAVLV